MRAKNTKILADDGHLIGYARVSTNGQETAVRRPSSSAPVATSSDREALRRVA